MNDLAYAMGQLGGASGGQAVAGSFSAFVPLILMFVIFYFLLIRPQQKKAKEHTTMLESIKKGDRIITTGGIHGKITAIDEAILTVEIAEIEKGKFVRVKINKGNVSTVLPSSNQQSLSSEKMEKTVNLEKKKGENKSE